MHFMTWSNHKKLKKAQPVSKPISHKWSEEETMWTESHGRKGLAAVTKAGTPQPGTHS